MGVCDLGSDSKSSQNKRKRARSLIGKLLTNISSTIRNNSLARSSKGFFYRRKEADKGISGIVSMVPSTRVQQVQILQAVSLTRCDGSKLDIFSVPAAIIISWYWGASICSKTYILLSKFHLFGPFVVIPCIFQLCKVISTFCPFITHCGNVIFNLSYQL